MSVVKGFVAGLDSGVRRALLALGAQVDAARDASDRSFLRANTGRTSDQLVQYGTLSDTTNTNGQIFLTFDEPFTTPPTIVVCRQENTATSATVNMGNRTTTGATFRCYDNSGASENTAAVTVAWFAAGPKTDL